MDIEVASGINVFHGANGAGKTSILEAAFLVSRGRSFRSQRLQDVVRQGTESSWVAAGIGQDASTRTTLAVGVDRSGQRVLKVGDEPVSRVSRLAALLPV
ncbi:MAG: AAA family ATPase, partial [Gammaproteobacteria bacterium]